MSIDPKAAGFDTERLARVTTHLEERYIATGKIPGCHLSVVRGKHTVYNRTLGLMDRERMKPVRDDTIWRIFSMTKPMTSVALMQLYEHGAFLLSDPVERFIPSWKNLKVGVVHGNGSIETVKLARPVTILDTLVHTTGLANLMPSNHPIDRAFAAQRRDMGPSATLESVCELLAQHPLKFQPGTKWNYGLSTDVCAHLVEIVSGAPFDEYLRTEIFEPLGMIDTGFFVPDHALDRLAANYSFRTGQPPSLGDDPQTSSLRRRPSYLSGSSGLVSTMSDFLRFCDMLLHRGAGEQGRILAPKTLELMTVNHLPNHEDLTHMALGFGESGFDGFGFGLGFAIGQGPAATGLPGSAGEFSWGGAASSAFWIDPAEELAVVFMTQLVPWSAYPFRSELRALVYQALIH